MTDTFDYEYTREIITSGAYKGVYNINNPNRKTPEGKPIKLFAEITDAFPTKVFRLDCFEGTAIISFETGLTEAEHTQLSTIVSNHKNNT
jgi:hypothetical protein